MTNQDAYPQTDRLRDACRVVLHGFDEHIFIRSIEHDHEPTWGLRIAPYLQALAVMVCETGYKSADPAPQAPMTAHGHLNCPLATGFRPCQCDIPRCPVCGYTAHDALFEGDHWRCSGTIPAHPEPVLPTLDRETHVEPHQNRRESGASVFQPLAAVAAILTTLAVSVALRHTATPAGRHYHPIPLAQIAQAGPGDPIVPTHVVTAGTVRMVRQEADGDLHVRLCAPDDPATCIVLECIPELSCTAPRYGDHVTARGISRWDTAHRWWELHPVLSLEVR